MSNYQRLINGRPVGSQVEASDINFNTIWKNYILFNNFENDSTTGWSLGTIGTLTNGLPTGTPTFGSGASGDLSISIGDPIEGAYSLYYTSSTATTAGNMLATQAYDIDVEDQAKVLTIKFYYKAYSGASNCNFSGTSSNSFAWAIYDVTNSSWLSSAGNFNLIQSSGCGYVTGTCQTNATTAQIRLVLYNANATSGAATLALDGFFVGPQTAPSGPAMTDWTAFTPTGTFTTNTTYSGYYRQVGSNAEIQYYITFSGAPNSTTLTVNYPPGLSLNSSAYLSSSPTPSGYGARNGVFGYIVSAGIGSSTIQPYCNTTASGSNPVNVGPVTSITQSSPYTIASGDVIFFIVSVPIAGWSSNSSMSSDTDTRVVAMQVQQASPSISLSTSLQVVIYNSPSIYKDTHDGYSTSTGLYTIPVTGYYRCVAQNLVSGTFSAAEQTNIQIYHNGTSALTNIYFAGGASSYVTPTLSGTIYCNAGDTLGPYLSSNASSPAVSSTAGAQSNFFMVERLSGPAVIAATESVNANYQSTAGTSIPANTGTTTIFSNKKFDTHHAYNTSTGVYTIPVSGKYRVTNQVSYNVTTTGASYEYAAIYYNSDLLVLATNNYPGGYDINSNNAGAIATGTVSCNAGDTITTNTSHNLTSTSASLSTVGANNFFSIERIGN